MAFHCVGCDTAQPSGLAGFSTVPTAIPGMVFGYCAPCLVLYRIPVVEDAPPPGVVLFGPDDHAADAATEPPA
jgi:hypothetical protein